jgi:hypothetical protein
MKDKITKLILNFKNSNSTPDEKLSRFTTNRLERDLDELITFLPSP